MKQIATKKITGKIVVKTGLHIGAGNDEVHIGGVDMPIIRNPINGEPYIPGSSIKGKMRSLMEWKLDKLKTTGGKVCSCGNSDCEICRVFGSANTKSEGANTKSEGAKDKGPTRLIVRDAVLTDEWKNHFKAGKALIEEKAENSLNRITAEAIPRFLERVVPGVEFDFEIAYRVIDIDDNGEKDKEYFETVVKESLRLLQNDYLGGGGSRGNGQIEFIELKDEEGKSINL